MIDEAKLQELEDLSEAAEFGPWSIREIEVETNSGPQKLIVIVSDAYEDEQPIIAGADPTDWPLSDEDAALIVASIEALPDLIAAARERDGLEQRRADIADRLRLMKLDLAARLHTICSELGGLVEGRPPESHNYLPRIRELRAIETERDSLRTALESQRQATEEAMRRAEEARRELADWKNCKPAQAASTPSNR